MPRVKKLPKQQNETILLQNIEWYAREHGYKPRDLICTACGISQAAYYCRLKKVSGFTYGELLRLAMFLRIPIYKLFMGRDEDARELTAAIRG